MKSFTAHIVLMPSSATLRPAGGLVDQRLKTLVAAGVLERRQYSERPPRFEYHPTEAGKELRPVLTLLNSWGTKWLADAPPTRRRYSSTTADTRRSRTWPAKPATAPYAAAISPSGSPGGAGEPV